MMSWTETVNLLGLDLLAGMLLALFALEVLEQAVHHAWAATRERFTASRRAAAPAPRLSVGSIKHV